MPHTPRPLLPSNRVVGALVLALVAVSLLYSAWTSYQLDAQARCQAELNAAFLEVLSNNVEVADADRDNLAETIDALGEADSSSERRDILDAYEQRRQEIDAQRAEYPPLPSQVCE